MRNKNSIFACKKVKVWEFKARQLKLDTISFTDIDILKKDTPFQYQKCIKKKLIIHSNFRYE